MPGKGFLKRGKNQEHLFKNSLALDYIGTSHKLRNAILGNLWTQASTRNAFLPTEIMPCETHKSEQRNNQA